VQCGSRGCAAAPGGAVYGEARHQPPRPPQGLRAWCRRPGSSTRSRSRVLTATQWRTKRRGSPPPRRAAQTPRRGILAAWCGGVAPPPRWPHSVHRAIAETPDATGAGAQRPRRGRSDDVDRHPRLLTGRELRRQTCLVMPQRCRRLTRPTPPRHPSCTGPSPTTAWIRARTGGGGYPAPGRTPRPSLYRRPQILNGNRAGRGRSSEGGGYGSRGCAASQARARRWASAYYLEFNRSATFTCASACPCSAANRYQRIASASSCATPGRS